MFYGCTWWRFGKWSFWANKLEGKKYLVNLDPNIVQHLMGTLRFVLFIFKMSFIKAIKMRNGCSDLSTEDKWPSKCIPYRVIWVVMRDMLNIPNTLLSSAGHQSAMAPFPIDCFQRWQQPLNSTQTVCL